MWTNFVVIVCFCQLFLVKCQYEVPDATIEVFTPKGFKVSIPDEGNVKLFAFHGKVNEAFISRESGTFSVDVAKPADGRWTYYNPSAKLQIGDILYFWTYVILVDGKGYPRDEQSFEVKELLPRPSPTTKAPIRTTATTKRTTASGPCDYTETTVNGEMSCSKVIIFQEPFNAIRPKFWNTEHKFAGEPDHEFVVYVDSPQTHEIKSNQFHIKPVLTKDVYGEAIHTDGLDLGSKCTGVAGSLDCKLHPEAGFIVPPVLSAQLNTKNKFSFKYGKIEITAKLPEGDWLYPELFLMPAHDEYGSHYYHSGQIRIAFTGGNANLRTELQGGCILGNNTLARAHEMKTLSKASSWSDDFHKFTVKWRPDGFILLVDGTVYGTIKPPTDGFASLSPQIPLLHAQFWKKGSPLAPFDKEMYLQIGLGAGGYNFEDRSDGSKPWKNGERLSVKKFSNAEAQWKSTWNDNSALIIDQIKVWAL